MLTAADAIVVLELQGHIAFKEAERLTRLMETETRRWLVLDAARVGHVDPVAERLLHATVEDLDARGVTVLLSGPWPAGLTARIKAFTSASRAVEYCESALLTEVGLPDPDEPVPLKANDLCAGMSPADVTQLDAVGVTLDLDQGDLVPAGDAAGEFALLFITRGIIGMQSVADSGVAVEDQITSRAAGTAVSSMAFEPTTGVPLLVAQTPATILALTVPALARVESEHPSLAATLYRNAAAAVAAEYRWSAAENVAMSR